MRANFNFQGQRVNSKLTMEEQAYALLLLLLRKEANLEPQNIDPVLPDRCPILGSGEVEEGSRSGSSHHQPQVAPDLAGAGR